MVLDDFEEKRKSGNKQPTVCEAVNDYTGGDSDSGWPNMAVVGVVVWVLLFFSGRAVFSRRIPWAPAVGVSQPGAVDYVGKTSEDEELDRLSAILLERASVPQSPAAPESSKYRAAPAPPSPPPEPSQPTYTPGGPPGHEQTVLHSPQEGYPPVLKHRPEGPQKLAFLSSEEYMQTHDHMVSPDGEWDLTLQDDGNLILYKAGILQWASGTTGTEKKIGGYMLVFEPDSNLAIYRGHTGTKHGAAVWLTNSVKRPSKAFHAMVENSGKLAIYRGPSPERTEGLVRRYVRLLQALALGFAVSDRCLL